MKKRLHFLFVAIICLFIFTACHNNEEAKEVVEDDVQTDVYTFGFSCLTMDNPYFIELETVMKKNIEAQGHVLITKDAESDAELQNQQIDEFIREKVDILFLTPVDSVKIEPALDRLKEAGIKVVNLDTQVQMLDKVDAYIGSDNSTAGELCGEDLMIRLPDGGKIIIVECPNRNSINERIQGFEKTIAKGGFEVVARIDAKGDLNVALPEVEEVLKNNPDVVAIMCGNDPTAMGALVAANAVAANNVVIYGIDGSPEVKEEIAKEGSQLVATVAQSTKQMGEQAVNVAMQIIKGEDFEKKTYIETHIVTKENIALYSINNWQ